MLEWMKGRRPARHQEAEADAANAEGALRSGKSARLHNYLADRETAGRRPNRPTVSPRRVCLQLDRAARSEPVLCPICGRPLRSTVAHRLPAFECDRCDQFSDFGGASSSPTQRGGSPP